MLRREFLAAVASFTAASAAAKAALAAASPPQEKAGEFFRSLCCDKAKPGAGAALVPPEFVDALKAIDERSQFERTLVNCLRDGSLVLVGVTSHHHSDYRAFYRPAKVAGEVSVEANRHETLMAMHDRGLIVIDSVNVYNGFTGVDVIFSICTRSST